MRSLLGQTQGNLETVRARNRQNKRKKKADREAEGDGEDLIFGVFLDPTLHHLQPPSILYQHHLFFNDSQIFFMRKLDDVKPRKLKAAVL